MNDSKPRIAVFAGPTATIMNSAPLVTSNLARRRHGLPPRSDAWGQPLRFDILRAQRLAKPVTVYVEAFSAHPMEDDAAELYAEPDGYLDAAGAFYPRRQSAADVAVYEIELRPEDGLFPLPYMGRRRDGRPGRAMGPALARCGPRARGWRRHRSRAAGGATIFPTGDAGISWWAGAVVVPGAQAMQRRRAKASSSHAAHECTHWHLMVPARRPSGRAHVKVMAVGHTGRLEAPRCLDAG